MICKCGHPERVHIENVIASHCIWCRYAKEPMWHKFQLDNLKYLESLVND